MEFLLIIFFRKFGLLILSLVGTLQNEVKSCNLGRASRLSRDLRKHTGNGHLRKVPGGFEPGTPGSPVQHSDH